MDSLTWLFGTGVLSVTLSIGLTVSILLGTSEGYTRRKSVARTAAFPTYSRGWRLVTTDEFEDVCALNEWYGEKYPSLRLYWNRRMFEYLQQRLDTMELL
jgi:hypothetical protein